MRETLRSSSPRAWAGIAWPSVSRARASGVRFEIFIVGNPLILARNEPFDLLTDRQGFPANEPGDEHSFGGYAISDSTKSVVAGKKWEKARARPLIEVVINEQAQLTPG